MNDKKHLIIYEAIMLNPENEFVLRFLKQNEKSREAAKNFLADVIMNELRPKYKTELKNGFLYFPNRYIFVYREQTSEAFVSEKIGLIHKDKLNEIKDNYEIDNYKILGLNFGLMNKYIWCKEKAETEEEEKNESV